MEQDNSDKTRSYSLDADTQLRSPRLSDGLRLSGKGVNPMTNRKTIPKWEIQKCLYDAIRLNRMGRTTEAQAVLVRYAKWFEFRYGMEKVYLDTDKGAE